MSSAAAAFDQQGRTLVAFMGKGGWTEVYLVDPKTLDMTRMWAQQADAMTSLRKFEKNCHPTMRPFKYADQ